MYLKYSEICGYYVDPANQANDSKSTTGAKKMLVIEGVPAATEYRVEEDFDLLNGKPQYDLITTTVYDADEDGEYPDPGLEIADANITKTQSTVTGGIKNDRAMKSTVAQPMDISLKNTVDPLTRAATGSVAFYMSSYGTIDSWSGYDRSVNEAVILVHSPATAYIFLGKKVTQLYYHTTNGGGDNPAGLNNTTATVGGATSTPNDHNGYEAATEAEQSFLYKIEEFQPNGSGGFESSASATFYEVISFPKNASINTYYYKKIKADPTCKYVITELTDWSWKYTSDGLLVNGGSTGASGVVATITPDMFGSINLTEGSKLLLNGSVDITSANKAQSNSAKAEYANTRKDSKKDIEGDTSIKRNTVTIKAAG